MKLLLIKWDKERNNSWILKESDSITDIYKEYLDFIYINKRDKLSHTFEIVNARGWFNGKYNSFEFNNVKFIYSQSIEDYVIDKFIYKNTLYEWNEDDCVYYSTDSDEDFLIV